MTRQLLRLAFWAVIFCASEYMLLGLQVERWALVLLTAAVYVAGLNDGWDLRKRATDYAFKDHHDSK